MGKVRKREIVDYLNAYLRIEEINDVSLNGLVVDNEKETVGMIGVATDASLDAIKEAKDKGVDLLIVHHGFYWGLPLYIDLWLRKRLKYLFDADMALYVAHLPLDIHNEVGNNYGAVKILGFDAIEPFGDYHGIPIGLKFKVKDGINRIDQLVNVISQRLFKPKDVWHFGREEVDFGVYCSGGCLSILDQVKRRGIDLFITGETSHAYYNNAKDMECNVILLGHYRSETVGVSLLGEHLKEKFGIEYVFVGEDTGL